MQEDDFNLIDFVNRMNEFSKMTFAEAASHALRNIIGKMSKKSGEGDGKC